MTKIYLCIITCFLFVSKGLGQVVTVTNPTNTTPNLTATYGSLSAAITALSSITAINGPVVITLNAANNETAPAGGYVIQFTATTTAANNITFSGSNNTITAFAPQASGALNDGIFKIIGADYITIQNFIMQENAANAVNTPAASNNMTEWGIALLRGTTTDGAQNNIIQNNTISLNRNYRNSFGIYSNARHTPTAPTTATDATDVSGSNLGNKVYGNNISNVMSGITFIGTATPAFQDAGNDIGGSSAATGNTITNWGGNTALSSFASNLLGSACIYTNHQTSDNISYNTINSGLVGTGVSIAAFSGIRKHYSTSPIGTFTSNISFNTITMTSDFSGGAFDCIRSQGMSPLSTATINISHNNLINNTVTATSTSIGFSGIINDSSPGAINISDNIIRGYNAATLNGFTAINQNGAIINTIDINYNKIGDAIAGALISNVPGNSTLFGIFNGNGSSTAIVNVNNNSMDGFSIVNAGQIGFIYNVVNAAVANINNNQLGTVTGNLISFSGAQTLNMDVIYNGSFAATSVSIQNNDIRGIVNSVTSTASQTYINCAAPSLLSTNISNNTFTNLSINSSNQVTLISRASNLTAGSAATISNNRIVGTFSKTASGNVVNMYISSSFSVSGSATTISGNNFSNVTLTGVTGFYGIRETDGSSGVNSPNKTISGNTISNITMGNNNFFGLLIDKGPILGIASNTISNIISGGGIYPIYLLTNAGTNTIDISSNTINTLNSTAEDVYGLRSVSVSPAISMHNNSITGLLSGGNSKTVSGIYFSAVQTVNIYDNIINNFTGTGGGSSTVNGIWISNGTANIYRNKIHSLLQSGTVSSSPAVNGMLFSNGTTVTAYNNFVANLNASNADLIDAIRGISVTSTTASSIYNLYYNSIYLNASSTGTNFGTSGIYHLTNATATTGRLNMIDNIIVNRSTANGTGITAAYRRSDATLTNFASTSDYNLFYAGTPSATYLIFHDGTNSDQTLAAYQTRVSTRDANSVSLMPVFASTTDLHLVATTNCGLDGYGTPIGGITTDIDAQSRDVDTPDMGADEFTATYNGTLAGIVGTAVCENKRISVSGITYATSACNVIATLLPSGGSAVTGKVNICVTLDATVQFFNGAPYLQRHFDIEPATNPATATARVTLYALQSEFDAYNAANIVFPDLPSGAGDVVGIANLRVTQYHGTGTAPGNYTGAGVLFNPADVDIVWNATNNWWEISFNVTGFSGFYIHTTLTSGPLPITINYFNGSKQGNNHLLNWKVTCNTTPTATMILERSADSHNFSAINSITADAARCNQPFDHTDNDPLKGMNYYRLKMIDADSKISYSAIIALLNAAKGFDIISIAPNPVVTDHFKLNVSNARASKMDITIVDMQGRIMNRQTVSVIAGFNSLTMNVSNLEAGTYTIQGSIADDKSRVIRFVKQ